MINYNESKIYKLCCRDTSIEDIYVGSTINFTRRKCGHKSKCNNPNSDQYNKKAYQFIRDNGGWDNWDMILLEEVKVNSKLELHKKEREYVDLLKPSLNIAIPTLTIKEYRDINKEYFKKYMKEYRINNKEYIIQFKKEHYQNNKEIISEKTKEKTTCECGSVVRKNNLIRHRKTPKHIKLISA
tara:strand:+ start:67 stop:618 length:552 start_codon:yes stop_codon:yes gene_type:complete